MRKMLLSTISVLITCGTVYAAGSPETPAATPAAATPVPTTPAAVPATPAAATPAAAVPATPTATPAVMAPAAPATPAATPAAPAATTASLSGTWSSNLVGDLTLEQTGNKIVGTYQYTDEDEVTQDGKLEGVIEGKTIKAKWWQRPKVGKGDESRGDLQWKIADDGKALTGWYREEGEKDKTDWNLNR